MFTETQTRNDDIVGIACEGKLTKTELEQMHALLHERLEGAGKPGLVLDLKRFEGYDEPAAILEDLKIDTAHAQDFCRIALIGDGKWMEWGTKLAGILTRAEMRWFDVAEMDAAISWARGR